MLLMADVLPEGAVQPSKEMPLHNITDPPPNHAGGCCRQQNVLHGISRLSHVLSVNLFSSMRAQCASGESSNLVGVFLGQMPITLHGVGL